MQPKFKRILYGGDYNPNQWPEEVWKAVSYTHLTLPTKLEV